MAPSEEPCVSEPAISIECIAYKNGLRLYWRDSSSSNTVIRYVLTVEIKSGKTCVNPLCIDLGLETQYYIDSVQPFAEYNFTLTATRQDSTIVVTQHDWRALLSAKPPKKAYPKEHENLLSLEQFLCSVEFGSPLHSCIRNYIAEREHLPESVRGTYIFSGCNGEITFTGLSDYDTIPDTRRKGLYFRFGHESDVEEEAFYMSALPDPKEIMVLPVEFGIKGHANLWARVEDAVVDTGCTRLCVPGRVYDNLLQAQDVETGKNPGKMTKMKTAGGEVSVVKAMLDIKIGGMEISQLVIFNPSQIFTLIGKTVLVVGKFDLDGPLGYFTFTSHIDLAD